jgi:hypothetical protein
MALDYLIMVFLSSLGVIQVACAYSRLRGLLFLGRPLWSALLGAGLVVAGFAWFFAPGPRLIPDTEGGLDGNSQTGLFAAGAGAAVAATMVVSSILNHRRLPGLRVMVWGLEALRETIYLKALVQGVKELWRRWPEWTRRSSSGSTAG